MCWRRTWRSSGTMAWGGGERRWNGGGTVLHRNPQLSPSVSGEVRSLDRCTRRRRRSSEDRSLNSCMTRWWKQWQLHRFPNIGSIKMRAEVEPDFLHLRRKPHAIVVSWSIINKIGLEKCLYGTRYYTYTGLPGYAVLQYFSQKYIHFL
jgi:hypothetical protein